MTAIQEILNHKGSHVFTIGGDATVYEAALLMNEHKIGGLVVTEDQRVVGIFTERDVLRRIVAEGKDPKRTRVRDVMTRDVVCCEADTSIDQARSIFMQRRIRHLPVVNGDSTLAGLVSIGDLNAHRLDAQEATILYLHEYLYGRV